MALVSIFYDNCGEGGGGGRARGAGGEGEEGGGRTPHPQNPQHILADFLKKPSFRVKLGY